MSSPRPSNELPSSHFALFSPAMESMKHELEAMQQEIMKAKIELMKPIRLILGSIIVDIKIRNNTNEQNKELAQFALQLEEVYKNKDKGLVHYDALSQKIDELLKEDLKAYSLPHVEFDVDELLKAMESTSVAALLHYPIDELSRQLLLPTEKIQLNKIKEGFNNAMNSSSPIDPAIIDSFFDLSEKYPTIKKKTIESLLTLYASLYSAVKRFCDEHDVKVDATQACKM